MTKTIVGAVGSLLSLVIIAMALNSADIPDPEREIVNALPNTDSNVKDLTNGVLDVRDTVETAKTAKNTATALWILIAGITSAGIGYGWLSRR